MTWFGDVYRNFTFCALFSRQVVDDFVIDAQVTEPQQIKGIDVVYEDHSMPTRKITDWSRDLRRQGAARYQFRYDPTRSEQMRISRSGLHGDAIITYTLVDEPSGSHTQV